MVRKFSKRELVAIAGKLLAGDSPSSPELRHIIDDFETALPWPYATDVICKNKQEFRDAVECIEFLLGQEKKRVLSREELIEVARRLMEADVRNEVDLARLGGLFEANVPHPDGTDLIFYPKVEFDTPEALVDYALSYKPSET